MLAESGQNANWAKKLKKVEKIMFFAPNRWKKSEFQKFLRRATGASNGLGSCQIWAPSEPRRCLQPVRGVFSNYHPKNIGFASLFPFIFLVFRSKMLPKRDSKTYPKTPTGNPHQFTKNGAQNDPNGAKNRKNYAKRVSIHRRWSPFSVILERTRF